MDANRHFDKDPDVNTFFTVDWASDVRDGETLSSTSWPVITAGLTADSDSLLGTVSTLWCSGGTAGTTYAATCRAAYDSGRTEDWTIYITCKHS